MSEETINMNKITEEHKEIVYVNPDGKSGIIFNKKMGESEDIQIYNYIINEDDKGNELATFYVQIATIGVKEVIFKQDPLSILLDKLIYKIKTVYYGKSYEFMGTVPEIYAQLKETPFILNKKVFESNGFLEKLIDVITGKGDLIIDNTPEEPGYYALDDKLIKVGASPRPLPAPEELKLCLESFEEFELISNIPVETLFFLMKWFMIAPYSFIFKDSATKFKNVIMSGTQDTSKTEGALIFKKINYDDPETDERPFGSYSTEARLGITLSKSTYPQILDEAKGLFFKTSSNKEIVNDFMEDKLKSIFRSKKLRETASQSGDGTIKKIYLSLSPYIATANMKEITTSSTIKGNYMIHADSSNTATQEDKEIYLKKWEPRQNINSPINKWYLLGDFVENTILKMKPEEMHHPEELAVTILKEAYDYAGLKISDKVLSWETMPNSIINDAKTDNALDTWFDFKAQFLDIVNKNIRQKDPNFSSDITLTERISAYIDNGSSFMYETILRGEEYYCFNKNVTNYIINSNILALNSLNQMFLDIGVESKNTNFRIKLLKNKQIKSVGILKNDFLNLFDNTTEENLSIEDYNKNDNRPPLEINECEE
jgi:hypothetical protein